MAGARSKPDLSVIIPARDAELMLAWALDGVAEQDYHGDWEVIVVDNGSSDRTGQLARSHPAVSTVVRVDGRGPADSRNAGARAARGGWLAFLDSDCRPTASWLCAGTRALDNADLVQGMTLPDPQVPLGPFDRTLAVIRATGLYESANLFVSHELFDRVGGFDHFAGEGQENERPFGEDVRFGWHAKRLGARTAFCDEALVHHAVFKRSYADYLGERARLRFFPQLARELPELRDHFFYRRWFLTRRSARFDLALAGALVAGARRQPLALAAGAPYLADAAWRLRGGGPRYALKMLLAELAADAISFGALCEGSIANRKLVL